MSDPSLEVRAALVDLINRYAAAVDERRGEDAAALFTEDGVLASPQPPKHLDPVTEAVGPAQVAETMATLKPIPATQHAIVGIVLDVPEADSPTESPNSATGRVSCIAHHFLANGTDLVWHVVYSDRYARTEAGWRFARRELHVQAVVTNKAQTWRGAPPRERR